MAPQSLVLVRLFCFVMLARHSEPWGNHKCYHSLRLNETEFKGNYADFVDHLREEWRQRVDITIETASKNKWLVKCEFDVSCETFRCKHENGDDIFVVNGCGKEKEPNNSTQCTLRTHLTDYCNMNKYPHSFPSCSQCYDQECNENRIKLTNPSDMTKKPNHCIHAFRHNKSYELDPKLEDMMASWQIFNLTLKYNHECLKYYPGCQTYRCKNEFGNDIFVVNGCATEHNEFKCAYKELDPFCLPQQNMYDHCEYCEGKSCNLNKIELETLYTFKSRATKATTRSTTATTTTDALDNETDEPESTKGPKKTARSTKRTRRPRASKRPNTPTPKTFTDAAVAAHSFAVPAVLLSFCCIFRKFKKFNLSDRAKD